jgi:hypothetical protein
MLLDPRPGSVTGAFFLCGFERTLPEALLI